uniref:Uncharacterized protein n=1 Tax=Arundo donax TaxID=35708 RepID=A0A0A9GAF2_ARUDO
MCVVARCTQEQQGSRGGKARTLPPRSSKGNRWNLAHEQLSSSFP